MICVVILIVVVLGLSLYSLCTLSKLPFHFHSQNTFARFVFLIEVQVGMKLSYQVIHLSLNFKSRR